MFRYHVCPTHHCLKTSLGFYSQYHSEMSEKLCLQWNDFKESINSAFEKLREDKEFTDVTLACEDGQLIEGHKVILATSSPFFEKILQKSKHPHPLIYLKGFQSKDLASILDFLYLGEANVLQEDLDSSLYNLYLLHSKWSRTDAEWNCGNGANGEVCRVGDGELELIALALLAQMESSEVGEAVDDRSL